MARIVKQLRRKTPWIHHSHTILCLSLLASCTNQGVRSSRFQVEELALAPLNLELPHELENYEQFGPFAVDITENMPLALSTKEHCLVNVFSPITRNLLPLIVLSHGNRGTKESFFEQAKHLATWGFHVVTPSFPNYGQWIENGQRLASLSRLIQDAPWLFAANIQTEKIILAGHSFGGSAVALALGSGAPAIGGILLDPALYSPAVATSLRQNLKPIMVLGADTRVFRARRRSSFFKETRGKAYEISIKESHHDDAQNPSIREIANIFNFDPLTASQNQRRFAAALTVAANSLARSGDFAVAYRIFQREQQQRLTLVAHRAKGLKNGPSPIRIGDSRRQFQRK
jgi:pimeloyl-ACP methyl ester carboxylesterase